jgi:hypothetical protein
MNTKIRIRYGNETREELPDGTPLYVPRDSPTCPDCAVEVGNCHVGWCDVEQCPICHTQLISCEHGKVILDA